jgi:transcriptional regulator with XRE-family HTH domain
VSQQDRTTTRQIGERVRRRRDELGWSQNDLADRCAERGMPSLNRPVLANLEGGRRRYVTVDELLVLGFVLRVTPVTLLPPDARNEMCGDYALDDWVGTLALVGRDMRNLLHRVTEIAASAGTADQQKLVDGWAAMLERLMGDLDEARRTFPRDDDGHASEPR